jgi:hypothetical protein
MRIALALIVGLWVVGCSHAGAVSDDPRLAALERVHPNGHIPTLDHHASASMDLEADAAPSASASRSKTTLVARNEVPGDDVGSSELTASPKSSAADAAFDSPTPKAKKAAKVKKAARRASHHSRAQ